jgi:adenine-specific DNA-methyltransferase
MQQLSFEDFSESTATEPVNTVKEPAFSRALGHVATPTEVVEFMVRLTQPIDCRECRVLEPACGDARFLQAFARKYGTQHKLVGVEINREAAAHARELVGKFATVIETDFLLYHPRDRFDIIIGNPPYGIVGDSSHYPIHLLKSRKEEYKKVTNTWRGKYNIYGAFIEKSVRLLSPRGKLIFVVPTTWMILDDFSLLRRFLSQHGRLTVFYLGRVFPGVNVSAVVLLLEKGKTGICLHDLRDSVGRLGDIEAKPCVDRNFYSGEMIRFENDEWLAFERSGVPIGRIFHIHFAARSPEFRRSGLVSTTPGDGLVPVLTGRNLGQGFIDYESCFSGWWMRIEDSPRLRWFYGLPHLVVGHTKGLRMVCAVDWKCYPWREEYHLVPREGISVDWSALEQYLGSELIQRYLQMVYRDVSPHLTKTVLQRIPVPDGIIHESAEFLCTSEEVCYGSRQHFDEG